MPLLLTGSAEPESARSGHLAPRNRPRPGDLAAAAAAAAVLIQLALAQFTLGLTALFLLVGRLTRWRPTWLAWPAAAGLGLVIADGAGPAVAGYLAAARHLIGFATGPGPVLARLPHLAAAFGGWRHWLPAQLPAALVAAAAEAGAIGRIARPRLPYRPGALAAVRRAYLTASLRRGEVATVGGGCVGIVTGTGRRAEISWREAEAGVLVTGASAAAVTSTGLDLATAAIQHRKSVIIIDLAGSIGDGRTGWAGDGRAGWAGDGRAGWTGDGQTGDGQGSPAVSWPEPGGRWPEPGGRGLTCPVTAACADRCAPLLRLGDPRRCYDPLTGLPPARAAGLVMAMIDWAGTDPAGRSLCAGYLGAALEVIAGCGRRPGWQRHSVIHELAGLLRPGELQIRLGHLEGAIRDRDALDRRAGELASRLDADPRAAAALATAAAQLAGLAAAPVGGWLAVPAPASRAGISLARAVAGREVVLACLDPRRHGQAGVLAARLAVADLTGILAERGDTGAPADCAVWINGCEAIAAAQLSALLALGPVTGTAVLLGTTADAAAADLARKVNVLAVRGQPPRGVAVAAPAPASQPGPPDESSLRPEARTGSPGQFAPAGQHADGVALRVRGPRPRLVQGCRAVR